jgi:transposase-like protein
MRNKLRLTAKKKWLYAAIDIESRLLLEIDAFSRRGTDPAAGFLHRLTEKHDVANIEFLVDAAGYLTALAYRELNGQLDYRERNHIEKWFHTVTIGTSQSRIQKSS